VSAFLKVHSTHQAKAQQVQQLIAGKIAFISFATVAELLYWAEKDGWQDKRRAQLDQRLRAYGLFDPVRSTAEAWATVKHKCASVGLSVSEHDLWIAASALEHSVPVITDDKVFDGIQKHVPITVTVLKV
jgi:predicted nucleic acid-binding protein